MSKRKLLLADDSITIQKVVNLTFADEGIEVIAVGDGNSAIDKLREDMPDLVMADVNMPGLNGYEICEKIKQSEFGNSETPVILLVGSFEPFDEDEAKRVGADDYLTKPFQSISQLVDKVSKLLNLEDQESFEDTAEMFLDNQNYTSDENNLSDNSSEATQNDDLLNNDFIDDEMIQTAQVGSIPIDDAVKYDSTSELPDFSIENENVFPNVTSDNEEPDFNKTQPFTENDFQELSIEEQNEDSISNVSSDIESEITENSEIMADSDFEDKDFDEDSELRLENPTELEDSDLHLENETAENDSELPMPEAASILELDEFNLLDLPPLEIEENDYPTKSVSVNEDLSDKSITEVDYKELTEGIDEDVSQATLNAIAKKVVERVSEKAIREIAWEVVPELAELIIKKMAKEKIKD